MPSIRKIWNTLTDIPKFPVQGSIFGQGHWKRIEVETHIYHLDTSTGLVFRGPSHGNTCVLLRLKGFCLAIAMPIYTAGVVVYNLGRIIPVICYLAGHIFAEYHSKDKGEKTFGKITLEHLQQIGIETGVSLRNVVRTPFYAIGMLWGSLWAIIDPFNGMKILGSFEHHWNHGKSIYGPHLEINCVPFKNFACEGGGDPKKLRDPTYFLAPCCGLRGVVKVNHRGEIQENTFYHVPKDITNFKWSELEKTRNFTEEKVEAVGRGVIPCCCLC